MPLHVLHNTSFGVTSTYSLFRSAGGNRGNGLYWIDPNGGSTGDAFQAFCDMTTENGGWTLVSNKVSPDFLFITSTFSGQAAQLTKANSASRIHPSMGDWTEVMFRFSDSSDVRLIYNRKAGAPSKEKQEFENFLMGVSTETIRNVHGFYKYSPADGGNRTPAVGFATVSRLHFYSSRMISEDHRGTDKWLDMWNGAESSNNYIYSDNSKARGTKCIAGYCYLNKPIWFMVR